MGCGSSSAVGSGTNKKFHEVYKLGRKLGEGAFGQVRHARKRESDQDLAVKIVDVRARDYAGEPTKMVDNERRSATLQEIDVWDAIGQGPNTVALQEHFFDKNLFYMVMEKCDCSLMDKLSRMNSMMESDLIRIFSEMLLGIQHVHEQRIAHRDIKPDNFLFGGPDGSIVKLCDFGLAAKMPKKGLLKGVYGTAPYMSPEMLGTSGYDEKTDVWSFGATAFLMIHGDFPYTPREATAPAMKKVILAGRPEIKFNRPPDEDQFFSPAFVDRATPFLQALLQRAPGSRKTAIQALELTFISPSAPPKEAEVVFESEAEEAPLAPAFRKARKATQNFKEQKPIPIAQKTLDELLTKLEAKQGQSSESPVGFFFSETDEKEEERQAERIIHEKSDDRIHSRSQTRYSTHSGIVSSSSTLDLKALRSMDIPEDAGESTGTGGDEEGSNRSGDQTRGRAQTHPEQGSAKSPSRQPGLPRPIVDNGPRYGGSS